MAAKVLAPIAALSVLAIIMLGPMYVFRVYSGIPLDAKGPEGEIWFLVIGGGLGAGAAYLMFHYILTSVGGFNETEVEGMWRGKKGKNT